MISIPAAEILSWTSTFVSISVKFMLAVYFLHRYNQKKMEIPLVWAAGFFFFGLSQIPIWAMRYFQDTTTNMYFALLGAFLAALSLALLYYGTSLLYFRKGSFMREKLSIIFFVIMTVVILAFPYVMSTESVLSTVFLVVASGFIFPILFIVAIIFFIIWHRLEPTNARKPNVFIVAVAWLMYSLLNGLTSTFFLKQYDWVFFSIATISFLLLLYGMTLGKATGH